MVKYRIQNVDAVRFFQVMLALLITTVIMAGEVSPVYAADAANVVTAKFTSLQNLVSGIVSSIGSIITLWGISEWGIAFQGSEGTMQANCIQTYWRRFCNGNGTADTGSNNVREWFNGLDYKRPCTFIYSWS